MVRTGNQFQVGMNRSLLFIAILVLSSYGALSQINLDGLSPAPLPPGDSEIWTNLKSLLKEEEKLGDTSIVDKIVEFLAIDSSVTNRKLKHVAEQLLEKDHQIGIDFLLDNLTLNFDNKLVSTTDFGSSKLSKYPFFYALYSRLDETDVLKNFIFFLITSRYSKICCLLGESELFLIKLLLHKFPFVRFLNVREVPGMTSCSGEGLRYLLDDDLVDVPRDLVEGKINRDVRVLFRTR